MTYRLGDRFAHSGKRFKEISGEDVIYVVGTTQLPLKASPILITPEELGAIQDPSIVRTERHDWVIDYADIAAIYPPKEGHIIKRLRDGSEFRVASLGNSEPCYLHTTSDRGRVVVHTVRNKVGTPKPA